MAMRVEQQYRFKVIIPDEIYHHILLGTGFHAGVDDGAFAGFIIEQVGVFLVWVVGK